MRRTWFTGACVMGFETKQLMEVIMKNYELIVELMKLPAGYDVSFETSVTKEDLNSQGQIFAGGTVDRIEVNESYKRIEILC